MCFFITATLPKDVDLEELKDIFNEYSMAFNPIKNNNADIKFTNYKYFYKKITDFNNPTTKLL